MIYYADYHARSSGIDTYAVIVTDNGVDRARALLAEAVPYDVSINRIWPANPAHDPVAAAQREHCRVIYDN